MPKATLTLEEHQARKHAYNQSYYKKNHAKLLAYAHNYRTEHPESIKEARQLSRITNNAHVRATERAWYAKNRQHRLENQRLRRPRYQAHTRAYRQTYYQEHRQEILTQKKSYARNNPDILQANSALRRARKKTAPMKDLSTAQWREIKAAFDHRCAYCGRKMQRLTQDHVTPYVHGGSHTLWNVVPACQSCNSRKGPRPPLAPVQPLLLTIAPAKKEKKS